MSSPTPTVSFVVIGYNERANLPHCLASIFAQADLPDHEVIVVDDASTDDSAAIVTGLMDEHPDLRLVRHPENRGRGGSRRSGQDASHGEAVAFIDADIRLPAAWYRTASAALRDFDAVSGVAVPDGDCAVLWRMFKPKPKGAASYWQLTGNNVLIRRSALDRVGWPAARRRSEDNRMARAMADAGLRLTTLPALRVEHHEAKTYRQTLRHHFGTGYHSNEILRDLRRFRFPDLVWLCWVGAIVGAIVVCAAGVLSWPLGLAIVAGVTLAIDVGSMAQRFYFWPNPLRWLGVAIGNVPILLAYLVSRTINAPRILLRPQSTEH